MTERLSDMPDAATMKFVVEMVAKLRARGVRDEVIALIPGLLTVSLTQDAAGALERRKLLSALSSDEIKTLTEVAAEYFKQSYEELRAKHPAIPMLERKGPKTLLN